MLLIGDPKSSSLPYLGRLRTASDGAVLAGVSNRLVRFDGGQLTTALAPVSNVSFSSGSFCLMTGGNFLTGDGYLNTTLGSNGQVISKGYYLHLISPTGLRQEVDLGNLAGLEGIICDLVEKDGGFLVASGNHTSYFKNKFEVVDSRPNLGLCVVGGRVYGYNAEEVFEVGGRSVAKLPGGLGFRHVNGFASRPICAWDEDTILIADSGIFSVRISDGAISRVFSETLNAVGLARWRDSLIVSTNDSLQIID